jgi:esterase/lipase superfamily enzyme
MPLDKKGRSPRIAGALLVVLSGCAGNRPYQVPFMPPPAFLERSEVTPFTDPGQVNAPADPQILYATLREPATVAGEDRFYASERAAELRLGSGRIALGASDVTWDEARQLSILKNNTDRYPLQVADVTEFGVLDRTLHPILHKGGTVSPDPAPRQAFSAAINARLARSRDKDIFIYVHGYRVNFENPLLVGAELWHFLGYQGALIPFAWPSHRGRLAYFGDTESARYSAIFFREFIEYLAAETDARRIHILGYSAGTRLVLTALHQLALANQHRNPEDIRRELRLGNVILVGSDVDRGIFGTYMLDGLLHVQQHMTIYESGRDKALGMAFFTFRSERVGQLDPEDLTPQAKAFLRSSDELALVSVESAPGFDHGNGHSYFRDSPWVSSDLLATLLYDLRPAARGLVQDAESGIWSFPTDYLARIEAAVRSADPELARRAGGLSAPEAARDSTPVDATGGD